MKNIRNEIKYIKYCQDIRHRLHMVPETGFDLPKTRDIIISELEKMKVLYYQGVGEGSIVAVISKGKDLPVIGFRADMDALYITEENDIEYKSKHPGKMHACGHDCHVAILLTTLKYILEEKPEFNCSIKAIFQAAEEGPVSGGRLVCQEKIVTDVESFFALHVNPDVKTGYIETKPNEFNASCDDFELTIYGKSGHAAYPDKAIDPIQIAHEIYSLVQNMKSREISQTEKVIISFTGVSAGSESNNIIPEVCKMWGTVRTYNKKLKIELKNKIVNIIKTVVLMHNATYSLTYKDECIPLINDNKLFEFVKECTASALGPEFFLVSDKTSMGVDDFAYYCDLSKGIMFNLGVGNSEKNTLYPLHNCHFNVDEDAFINGVKLYLEIIEKYRSL